MIKLQQMTKIRLLKSIFALPLIVATGISYADPTINCGYSTGDFNTYIGSNLQNPSILGTIVENHSPYNFTYQLSTNNGYIEHAGSGNFSTYIASRNDPMYQGGIAAYDGPVYGSNYNITLLYHGQMVAAYNVAKNYTAFEAGDITTANPFNTSFAYMGNASYPGNKSDIGECLGHVSVFYPSSQRADVLYAEITPKPDAPLPTPAASNANLMIVGDNGTVLTSSNGNVWQTVTTANEPADMQTSNLTTAGYGEFDNNTWGWVAAGDKGIFYSKASSSEDTGINWNTTTLNGKNDWSGIKITKVLWHQNFINEASWKAIATDNGQPTVLTSTDGQNWTPLAYTTGNYKWPAISDAAVTNADGWILPSGGNSFVAGTDMNPGEWLSHAPNATLNGVATAIGSINPIDPNNNTWYGVGNNGKEGVLVTGAADFSGPQQFGGPQFGYTNINNNALTITPIANTTNLTAIATRNDAKQMTWVAIGGNTVVSNYPANTPALLPSAGLPATAELNGVVFTNDPTNVENGYLVTVGNKGGIYLNAETTTGWHSSWRTPSTFCEGAPTVNLHSVAWNGSVTSPEPLSSTAAVTAIDKDGNLVKYVGACAVNGHSGWVKVAPTK